MKRLYLTVEGQTEQAFAMEVLQTHLASFDVFLHAPRLTGLHSRRRGRIPTGGMLGTFAHAMRDIRTWMLEDRSSDARFSMMVDLYSLPSDFPGYEHGIGLPTGGQQATAMEAALAQSLGDPRFIPYLQVHEFEALVLSDPSRIGGVYEVAGAEISALCRECAAFPTPEDINHGPESHPKKRIARRAPTYDENVAGPLLAGDIGLEALRSKCPHFGAWLTRLEGLDLT